MVRRGLRRRNLPEVFATISAGLADWQEEVTSFQFDSADPARPVLTALSRLAVEPAVKPRSRRQPCRETMSRTLETAPGTPTAWPSYDLKAEIRRLGRPRVGRTGPYSGDSRNLSLLQKSLVATVSVRGKSE